MNIKKVKIILRYSVGLCLLIYSTYLMSTCYVLDLGTGDLV